MSAGPRVKSGQQRSAPAHYLAAVVVRFAVWTAVGLLFVLSAAAAAAVAVVVAVVVVVVAVVVVKVVPAAVLLLLADSFAMTVPGIKNYCE